MRVQIIVSPEIKVAAEQAVKFEGYPSLAAYLRVMVTKLVSTSQAEHYKMLAATQTKDDSLATMVKIPSDQLTLAEAAALLPPPELFSMWPPHVGPSIARTDPRTYAFMIQQGLIRF